MPAALRSRGRATRLRLADGAWAGTTDPEPERAVPPAGHALDLVALDARGEVVAAEHPRQQ